MGGRHIDLGKRELSFFTGDMIDSGKPQRIKKKKSLELRSSYSKITGYKVNLWKSITLLNTSNEKLEIKKYIIFISTKKRGRKEGRQVDWGINLKYVEDLY